MKAAIAFAAASAAVAHAVATPASKEVSKRASGNLPTVTVKGNGKTGSHLMRLFNY